MKSSASLVIVYEEATRLFCLTKIELESTFTSLKSNVLTLHLRELKTHSKFRKYFEVTNFIISNYDVTMLQVL